MKEVKFNKCEFCGNITYFVEDKGMHIECCGQEIQELVPGTIDASHEKHVPYVEYAENKMKVQIGSIIHPMTAEHHIAFIFVQTNYGGQIRYLTVGDQPIAEFTFTNEKPTAVYEYCNLHGLWKTDIT